MRHSSVSALYIRIYRGSQAKLGQSATKLPQ